MAESVPGQPMDSGECSRECESTAPDDQNQKFLLDIADGIDSQHVLDAIVSVFGRKQ